MSTRHDDNMRDDQHHPHMDEEAEETGEQPKNRKPGQAPEPQPGTQHRGQQQHTRPERGGTNN